MSVRRRLSRHDIWELRVARHRPLLATLPPQVVRSEAAFREYLTRSTVSGELLSPSVGELSAGALYALREFLDRARFDVDALSFEAFSEAFRRVQGA